MRRNLRSFLSASGLGFLVISLLAAFAVAQDASAGKQPAAGEGGATADAEKAIREQSVYIPYEKLRQVFEKEGRGVFLPYEKFSELWKAAREQGKPMAEAKPPVGALITEVENEAAVEKDVVSVKAKVKIDLLTEGWHEIPLRLSDCAITRATIGGQPARLLGAAGQDYRLLVEKKGKQPEQIELNLEFAKAITKTPGQNSVGFQTPQAPISRWKVVVPQAGVKVNMQPLIAATEAPAEQKTADGKPREETVLLAFVGAAPSVRVEWTPKTEGASGLAALASVQAEQQVWVNEGVTRTRTQLTYTISRAELGQLAIEVPADQKVVNVFDANVRQWAVETRDQQQVITAQLFEPAKGSQRVMVELEKFVEDKAKTTLQTPVVKAVGVGRQQGIVVVSVAQGLRVETSKTSGLMQVDKSELPQALQGNAWAFSYRYSAVPFELSLDIEKVQPRIVVDSLLEAYLAPERVTLDLSAVYTIERAGVFRLEFDIPEGYEVRQVRGRELAGAAAAAVDSHHLEGEKKSRLVVNLARKALGRVGLLIELERELPDRDVLLQPGKAAEIVLAVPALPANSVERWAGRLMVYAPESLRVNPGKAGGLGEISFEKALEDMQTARERKSSDARPVLAYSYTQEPASLQLSVERQKPKVTMQQLLIARIDNGVIKYHAKFTYDVLYSGIKSLRIDVPKEIAAEVHNETKGVHEKAIEPQPKDVAADCVVWSFTGDSEFFHRGEIDLVWEKKLDAIEVGKSIDLKVPRLEPREVDRSWGQIVLVKAETLNVEPATDAPGLRPIDPQQDLAAPVAGAARAFEFHDAWKLPLTITQYELEDVKRTSIERAVVRMVVTPAGEISVQALYRIRSARQRLVVELGTPNFDTSPLRINGKPVMLEHGKEGEYFVPLTEANPDVPVLLELRYTVPGDGGRLTLPVFPHESAVLKVYVAAYLPEDRILLGSNGPWTEEYTWGLDPTFNRRPVPAFQGNNRLTDEYLVGLVREGINVAGNPADSLPTDGIRYLYSTLQPAKPPKGDLRLVSVERDWFRGAVFAAALLIGVLLLPTGVPMRASAIGAAVTALVLGGVFCPTFSMQILDGVFVSAIFVVLVLWGVWYFVYTRPRMLKEREAALAASVIIQQPAAKILGGVGGGIDLSRREPEGAPPPQDGQTQDGHGTDSQGEAGGNTNA